MSKSGAFILAKIILVLFVIGIIGITGTILIAMIYEIIAHPSDITPAGYALIAFVVYCVWLCHKILYWKNKHTMEKQKLSIEQNPVKRLSLSDRFARFMPGFWLCLLLVLLNGVVVSGIYISINSIVTLSTADRYEAEVTSMNATKSENRSYVRRRDSSGISIRYSISTDSIFTPIVRFQSKEGLILERELYFISGKSLEIGSKLPVYYSQLTDQAIHKSTFTYGMITVVTLVFLFLLILALVLFVYALLGRVPDWIIVFWNRIKWGLLYSVLFLGLLGMTCFLGSFIFQWFFDKSENKLPSMAIAFCVILFVGCLIGGTGMIFALLGRKPTSSHRKVT